MSAVKGTDSIKWSGVEVLDGTRSPFRATMSAAVVEGPNCVGRTRGQFVEALMAASRVGIAHLHLLGVDASLLHFQNYILAYVCAPLRLERDC